MIKLCPLIVGIEIILYFFFDLCQPIDCKKKILNFLKFVIKNYIDTATEILVIMSLFILVHQKYTNKNFLPFYSMLMMMMIHSIESMHAYMAMIF